jgi:putative hydrolase of the HAD superfamily
MMPFIGFDADDTLWHNENLFSMTHEKYRALLSAYHDPAWIDKKLFETEMRNLGTFGYGIKGFTLSMIETAIELTEGRIPAADIQKIIDFAREMKAMPVQLLDHAAETVRSLSKDHTLLLITKGDFFDQESKIAQSGLAEYFTHVEILTEKNEEAYRRILIKHGITPAEFLMVGNSMKSDILPVAALGAQAVFVPYHLTWAHEQVETDGEVPRVWKIQHLGELENLLKIIGTGAT